MTMRTPPAWLQAGNHTSENDRLHLEALLARRPGVLPSASNDLVVTEKAGTANMSVDVAAGHCIVDGSLNAHQGMYHGYNDATVNLTIAAADATNPRKDLVTVRVRDAAYSGADNDIDIVVTTGTPAPGLVQGDAIGEPTAPANSLKLARVFVPAADTAITNSQINDLRTFTAGVGGTVLCTSTTRPSAPHEGMQIYETDTDRSLVYNGAAWVCLTPQHAEVLTSETRANVAYGDLATVGPSVSLQTGTEALVSFGAQMNLVSAPATSAMFVAPAVSGASTIGANDNKSAVHQNNDNVGVTMGWTTVLFTSLTPGVNTFTLKYRTGSGAVTCGWQQRRITAVGVL